MPKPFLRPDLDQPADWAPMLLVTGALPTGKPLLAYEGRLQIVNAIGICTVDQIGGDALPAGSQIFVDNTASQVVVAWPAYSESASILSNAGLENGNTTGWSVTRTGGTGGTASASAGRPRTGNYSALWKGANGTGHAGGIEAVWKNGTVAETYPGRDVTASVYVALDDTDSSQNRGQVMLFFGDATGTPVGDASGYRGALIRGNDSSYRQSSLTMKAPAGARKVQLAVWTTANSSGGVRFDDAAWNAPVSVGTSVEGIYNLTLRVTDSAGRTFVWSGSITVASQTFLSTLLSYNPIFVLRLAEASGPTALNAAGAVNGAYSGGISPGSTALYSGGGTSAAMTATSGRAEYPGSGMASTPVGMTIGVIASLADITNIHMLLNRDDGVGGSTRYWQFRTNQTNLEFIDVLGSGTTVSFAHGKAPSSPALFIARYNATTGAVTLSVNGTVLGSGTTTTGLNFGTPGATSVCVGNYSGNTFDAAQAGDKYSEAFLIPSVLTDAQVAGLASAAGF